MQVCLSPETVNMSWTAIKPQIPHCLTWWTKRLGFSVRIQRDSSSLLKISVSFCTHSTYQESSLLYLIERCSSVAYVKYFLSNFKWENRPRSPRRKHQKSSPWCCRVWQCYWASSRADQWAGHSECGHSRPLPRLCIWRVLTPRKPCLRWDANESFAVLKTPIKVYHHPKRWVLLRKKKKILWCAGVSSQKGDDGKHFTTALYGNGPGYPGGTRPDINETVSSKYPRALEKTTLCDGSLLWRKRKKKRPQVHYEINAIKFSAIFEHSGKKNKK